MKTLLIILSIIAIIAIIVLAVLSHPAFGPRTTKVARQQIEQSPNYREGVFQNQIPTPQMTSDKGLFTAMYDFLFRRPKDITPKQPMPANKTNLKQLSKDEDWLVWFGHSSYLFCLKGKLCLVDPVLNMEFPASLMMTPFPGTDIYSPADLPQIDYLIITHEHWDHLDYATLRDLRDRVAHVICPLGIADYLTYWKYDKSKITEMDWYQKVTFGDTQVSVTCLPTRHFSNRLLKRNQTLWASFLIEAQNKKVYIGGDGGYDQRFKEIYEHFGQVDLALMENGQYSDDWAYIHLTPKDLEQAILDLNAKQVFTVHHDKFALSTHPWSEPDSIAHDIASRHSLNLLDQPIGTVVKY